MSVLEITFWILGVTAVGFLGAGAGLHEMALTDARRRFARRIIFIGVALLLAAIAVIAIGGSA